MEHHGADEEDNQRVILKERPDALRFAAFLAISCATGDLVVDVCGSD
jgi:hypothetical protein